MSDHPEPKDPIGRAVERLLSPQEWAALQKEVIDNPKTRADYVKQMWLDATLRAERDSLGKLLDAPPAPHFRRWPWAAIAVAGAAAGLILSLHVTLFPNHEPEKPLATLIKTQNCKWEGSDLPTMVQAKLGLGTLALVEGIATIQFDSGVTVNLEAPTKLEILSDKHCRLTKGFVVAEMPATARGFAIDTPDLIATGQGAHFGVTAGSIGTSHVYVFTGTAQVCNLAGAQLRQLTNGQAFLVKSPYTNQIINYEDNYEEPARSEPTHKLDGWISIPTSFGQGKDAFAQRGSKDFTGTLPLIMVKHTDMKGGSRGNERRAFLTFDVSQIHPHDISQAELVLDPQPSGYGFAIMIPDSRFAVYGITDHNLDYWPENELAWDSAPACMDDGLILNKVRKLAEFWIPRGGSGKLVTVQSEALAQFVREGTNGLVSFIIIRETGETTSHGLVHAFASKEHPTAMPPTLRVK